MFELQRDVEDAVIEFARDCEARFPEDLDHPVVLAEHVGIENANACRSRDLGQTLQQARADPAAAPRIRHRKGHLGTLRRSHVDVVACGPDDHPGALADEHTLPIRIRPDELLDLGVVELRHAHEPVVQGLRGHAVQHVQQPRIVVGTDRPKVNGRAVAKDNVGAVVEF